MVKYLVVEREKIQRNIAAVKARASGAVIYGVLKGNAYGFGLVEMADLLRNEGISHFAVTEVRDLVILRNSGFATRSFNAALHRAARRIGEDSRVRRGRHHRLV